MDLLRIHLNSVAGPDRYTRVVRVVLGDNNLNAQDVRKALQRRTDDEALWGFPSMALTVCSMGSRCCRLELPRVFAPTHVLNAWIAADTYGCREILHCAV